MLTIGPYSSASRVIVAPMAGVTDKPFRDLCRRLGSFWTVSEMLTSNQQLWETSKSRHRLDYTGEKGLSWVQLAGSDPGQIAEAAAINVGFGAQIIDINMGCPAKKVCNKAAGSALLRDESLVADILAAVIDSVEVPVTLKIRLGWSPDEINARSIAAIAESEGISLLTVHGRTRACRFSGSVDYDAIAAVKESVSIPVVANGDILTPQQAKAVLEATGCDAVMIGRAAQGKPWLPSLIDQYLEFGTMQAEPSLDEIRELLSSHVRALHEFYGQHLGLRIARKHVGWTLDQVAGSALLKQRFNRAESVAVQFELIDQLGTLQTAA
jgi:tRNA-dihydrouridine synthase B